jgi:hypothetical protein
MFFETHYNMLTSELNPRSIRRRELECLLQDETLLSPEDKDESRRLWAQNETNHLRELRAMKVRGPGKYDIVKVGTLSHNV